MIEFHVFVELLQSNGKIRAGWKQSVIADDSDQAAAEAIRHGIRSVQAHNLQNPGNEPLPDAEEWFRVWKVKPAPKHMN